MMFYELSAFDPTDLTFNPMWRQGLYYVLAPATTPLHRPGSIRLLGWATTRSRALLLRATRGIRGNGLVCCVIVPVMTPRAMGFKGERLLSEIRTG
jgi:hypothetical protein